MSNANVNLNNYLIYLETVQSSAIKTLSEALKEVLVDVCMTFDEKGIKIVTVDQSKIAFVHLKLDANKFEVYHCKKYMTIGLSVVSLYKLLKIINNTDTVTLFIHKDDEIKLGIEIENKEKKIKSVSKLKLLDIDDEPISIPPAKFDSIYDMQCADLQKHIRDLSNIAENVDIYTSANGQMFTICANGDFAEQEIKIGVEDPNETEENNKKIFIGSFKIKYLNLFCKSSSLCQNVQIYLSQNYPIILLYHVANLGTIKFGLGPNTQPLN